jgi:beta-aspartyl-peptidase (threonine type)
MPEPVIAIHGGAGTVRRSELTPESESALHAALAASLRSGYDILNAGGTSLDAVEQAVRVMEDSPLFNAGRGAVFTSAGTIELDASIMDGSTLRAGGVAAVRGVRNPVSLARAVMEHSPHVLLAGEGAEAFARMRGLGHEPAAYFHTEERWSALRRVRAAQAMTLTERDRHGTVGAVALDAAGKLAAATSTGGRTNKLPGRVGDSPIVGAGNYANTAVAVSGTGDGDVFLRTSAAYRVAVLMELAARNADEAARETLNEIARYGGSGGLVVLDRLGNVAMPFNTEGMYRGVLRSDGKVQIRIY